MEGSSTDPQRARCSHQTPSEAYRSPRSRDLHGAGTRLHLPERRRFRRRLTRRTRWTSGPSSSTSSIVLVAAKIAAEIAERINVPAVVGEIVAGIVIGPSMLGFVGIRRDARVLGELGVILLLLGVGMEMDLASSVRSGVQRCPSRASASSSRWWAGSQLRPRSVTATTSRCSSAPRSSATSVGITARVFSDLARARNRRSTHRAGRSSRRRCPRPRDPDRRGAARLGGLGVDRRRRADRGRGDRVPGRRHGCRRATSRPSLFQFLDRHARSAGHAGRARTRVHARVRRARRRREARPDRRGVRRRPRARRAARPSERIQRELAPGRPPVHPGLLPRDRHRSRGRDVRRTGGAGNRRRPARRRRARQARRRGRRFGLAGRQAAHRPRHDSAGRGRPDLRHHRAARRASSAATSTRRSCSSCWSRR